MNLFIWPVISFTIIFTKIYFVEYEGVKIGSVRDCVALFNILGPDKDIKAHVEMYWL